MEKREEKVHEKQIPQGKEGIRELWRVRGDGDVKKRKNYTSLYFGNAKCVYMKDACKRVGVRGCLSFMSVAYGSRLSRAATSVYPSRFTPSLGGLLEMQLRADVS